MATISWVNSKLVAASIPGICHGLSVEPSLHRRHHLFTTVCILPCAISPRIYCILVTYGCNTMSTEQFVPWCNRHPWSSQFISISHQSKNCTARLWVFKPWMHVLMTDLYSRCCLKQIADRIVPSPFHIKCDLSAQAHWILHGAQGTPIWKACRIQAGPAVPTTTDHSTGSWPEGTPTRRISDFIRKKQEFKAQLAALQITINNNQKDSSSCHHKKAVDGTRIMMYNWCVELVNQKRGQKWLTLCNLNDKDVLMTEDAKPLDIKSEFGSYLMVYKVTSTHWQTLPRVDCWFAQNACGPCRAWNLSYPKSLKPKSWRLPNYCCSYASFRPML